jgi:RNA polymerase sigma factor (sigma-70 family)
MRVLLRTQSDARLVALARAGHDRAFEAIVERYRRPLLRACRRILPEARAEDALQQALMAAWTALRRGDEVQDLRPWLYRIVRNTALNQLRVAGYDLDELVETLAAAQHPEEEVERRLLVRQTLAAVAALPERQRDALLRTAIEGRGQDEVARDLGLTDTALRQLVHRARVSVRAAATAVVPLPFAAWLAAAAPRAEPMAARIVELAAGSSAGATLAKAGTVALLAGGAVSAPALVDDHPADTRAAQERPVRRTQTPATAPVAPAVVVAARTEPAEPARAGDEVAGRREGERADRGGHDRDDRARDRDDSSRHRDDDSSRHRDDDSSRDRDHDEDSSRDDDRDGDSSHDRDREGSSDRGSSGDDESYDRDSSRDDDESYDRDSSRDDDESPDDESSGDGERDETSSGEEERHEDSSGDDSRESSD